jgi:hypothetical protein
MCARLEGWHLASCFETRLTALLSMRIVGYLVAFD